MRGGNTSTIILAVYVAFGLYFANSYFKFVDLSKIITPGVGGVISLLGGILLVIGGLNFLRRKDYYPGRR